MMRSRIFPFYLTLQFVLFKVLIYYPLYFSLFAFLIIFHRARNCLQRKNDDEEIKFNLENEDLTVFFFLLILNIAICEEKGNFKNSKPTLI